MAISVRQESSGANIGTSSTTTLTSPALGSASTSGWQGVTPVGQNQVHPGTGSNLISTGNITPTGQPCLASSYTYDDQGNAPSGTPSNVTIGVTDWTSGATTFATLTTGSTRLTSTSAFASTFTNATDGTAARFLNMQTLWNEAVSSSTATIAWTV